MTPTIPRPIAPGRSPGIRLPAGAVDCHAHVFADPALGGLLPQPHFVPHACSVDDYQAMLHSLGVGKAVLVQPSIYGSDNRVLLGALAQARMPMRAVVIVAPDVSDGTLQALHTQGVRGVRINTASATPGLGLHQAAALAERIAPLGWHLQFFVDLVRTPEVADTLARLPVPVVIDHFGKVPAAQGTASAAFRQLADLLALPHCWLKMMGPYFVSQAHPGWEDTDALAQATLRIAPDRCLWGTDWPHPSAHHQMPEDARLADILARWCGDADTLRRVTVDNPGRLYGF